MPKTPSSRQTEEERVPQDPSPATPSARSRPDFPEPHGPSIAARFDAFQRGALRDAAGAEPEWARAARGMLAGWADQKILGPIDFRTAVQHAPLKVREAVLPLVRALCYVFMVRPKDVWPGS